MSQGCARCGYDITNEALGATCPRCGAPRPDPAWTQPYSPLSAPTMASRSATGGGLAPGKRYALIVVKGEEPGRVIPIEKPRVTLGRADCDIVLADPELSRQHALIAIQGTSVRLEDLDSTNGTFVDEERIENRELTDRSEFRIGTHELVFVMRDEEV
jgi:pSer/pThr/pTyr-binding forkhead associated (FHA) protein